MDAMPNITLSIDKDNQEILRSLANKERRSISKQVIVMMEYYLRNNNDK